MTLSLDRRSCPSWLAALVVAVLGACAKPSPEALIAKAQQHIAEHGYSAAQIELRNAIQQAPSSGPAYRLLGATQLRLGDPAGAERSLRKALTLGEMSEDVLPPLAQALLRQGQPQKVIDEFSTARLQDPAASAALAASVGEARLMRGDAQAAAQAFAAALAARPDLAGALLGQARIAAHEGRLDDALASADKALAADPRLVEGHVFKSRILISKERRQPAIESLEKALSVDATYLPARLALASILIEGRDLEKAKSVLGGAGAAAKDPRVQYLRGLLASLLADLPQAKDALAQVLKVAPEHGPALALAGELELRTGNFALAEQHLSRAMRLQASPGVRRLLAATQLRQNRPGKALETLQPLLQELGPKDGAAAMMAGEAHLANGDVRRAGEYFEAAKAGGGNEASARARLAQLALRRGDFERVEQEVVAASELGTNTTEPELLLVALHLRRHEPAKALAAAQAFIKKQPHNPLGHVLAGTAQLLQQDRSSARESFESALKINAEHLPALRALADLDVAEGRATNAQKRYDALLAKKPDDDQLLLAVASLQERTGRGADAVKTLGKAIATNPLATEPVVALVQHHLRRKDAAAALTVAQEAVRNNPDEMNLSMLLGMTQEAAGASEDALRTLSALVKREPNALVPLLRLAQIQARQRDFDGAAASLQRAQEKAPHNDGVARDLVAVYVQAGRVEQALKVAKDLQLRSPEAAAGHLFEGDVWAHAKKWPAAERAYRTALEADPRATAAAGKVYRVMQAAGKRKEADDFAAEWTARHPSDVAIRLLVADRALRSRDFAAAIRHYEAALVVNPNKPAVLNGLAWALGQTKDPRAIGMAERAAALAPNSPDVLDTLGVLHLQSGNAKKGLEVLQRVRELAPDRPDLRMHYAKGLLQNGQTRKAKAELRELAGMKGEFAGKAEIAALLATP